MIEALRQLTITTACYLFSSLRQFRFDLPLLTGLTPTATALLLIAAKRWLPPPCAKKTGGNALSSSAPAQLTAVCLIQQSCRPIPPNS